jgi:formate hydrogenlyase subunit 6/NADH:ubiquinone oxidoreductase subunit I
VFSEVFIHKTFSASKITKQTPHQNYKTQKRTTKEIRKIWQQFFPEQLCVACSFGKMPTFLKDSHDSTKGYYTRHK